MKLNKESYAIVEVVFPPLAYYDINVGALRLSLGGREFIYDSMHTDFLVGDPPEEDPIGEDGDYLYIASQSRCYTDDKEFKDCPYDLTEEDLLDDASLKATFYVEGFDELEGASVTAAIYSRDRVFELANVKFE